MHFSKASAFVGWLRVSILLMSKTLKILLSLAKKNFIMQTTTLEQLVLRGFLEQPL